MNARWLKTISFVLVFSVTVLYDVTPARAMLAPVSVSDSVMTAQRRADMGCVQAFLDQQAVRDKLQSFGLSSDQIQSRLQNLSDQEVHQVAQRIDKQNPGASDAVTILIIAVLVLLFVYLLKRV